MPSPVPPSEVRGGGSRWSASNLAATPPGSRTTAAVRTTSGGGATTTATRGGVPPGAGRSGGWSSRLLGRQGPGRDPSVEAVGGLRVPVGRLRVLGTGEHGQEHGTEAEQGTADQEDPHGEDVEDVGEQRPEAGQGEGRKDG